MFLCWVLGWWYWCFLLLLISFFGWNWQGTEASESHVSCLLNIKQIEAEKVMVFVCYWLLKGFSFHCVYVPWRSNSSLYNNTNIKNISITSLCQTTTTTTTTKNQLNPKKTMIWKRWNGGKFWKLDTLDKEDIRRFYVNSLGWG